MKTVKKTNLRNVRQNAVKKTAGKSKPKTAKTVKSVKPSAKKTVKPVAKKTAVRKTTVKKPTTKRTVKPAPKKTVAKKHVVKKPATKKNKNEEKRSEFRTNKKSGHPTYIYQKIGKSFKYIGITHSPITQGVSNIELETNPNPEDNSKAYIRPKAKSDRIKNFKGKKKGWRFSEQDKPKVKRVIQNNNKNK